MSFDAVFHISLLLLDRLKQQSKASLTKQKARSSFAYPRPISSLGFSLSIKWQNITVTKRLRSVVKEWAIEPGNERDTVARGHVTLNLKPRPRAKNRIWVYSGAIPPF